jgi:cell division protease FtsH
MKKNQKQSFILWVLILLIGVMLMKNMNPTLQPTSQISFSEFIKSVESDHVQEVTFQGDNTILGRFKEGYENGKYFELTGNTGDETFRILKSKGIVPNYKKEEKQGLFFSMLINWLPMLIIVGVFFWLLKSLQAGGGKAMSFGKSRARMLTENDKKVTFNDVAGVEEAKEELVEIVDFLKDPKKYTTLGGKIPKGCLLVGPPGTGKTLLARAVAGEAGVPFFSISGSDFVEMFVGVGASRVRDLFEQGKKHAPCIIFIDEIDAVGRHRGAGMGGGHDEREQTLNQLLVEMDGFESNEGVIIMAATNRIDVLDPALLRPGRFDRRVTVGRPDVRGRHQILKVHTKKTPLDLTVELENIAKGTPGFTGADLANLVNEAALLAARDGKKALGMIDFESAKDKVLMGVARKSMMISDKEKKVTAYHEAGHTLVGMNLPYTDPIHKVSIIPRGQALGVTQTLPNEDMHNMSKEKGENFISFLMGGRCAEEIIFQERTNGASNDIERATDLARHMVCHWGMSEKLGPINYAKQTSYNVYGSSEGAQYSDETSRKIDTEIAHIVQSNYEIAKKILNDNIDALHRVAQGLIVWETLDAEQIKDLVAGKDIGIPEMTKPKIKEEKETQTPGFLPGKVQPA